ncbi:MAG: ATP-binding protein [Holophaga sp.]
MKAPFTTFTNSRTYDPRKRGWYQEARKLVAPRWSTPYRLDPPESRLVLTWLAPLITVEGKLEGALGIDLPPQEFRGFLEFLRPTPGSRIWVVDRAGGVVASAHGPMPDAPVPVAGGSVTIAGRRCRLLQSDIPAHAGAQWRMLLAIPEGDLLATAQGRLLAFTAVAFLLLMLPIFWWMRVSRRVANRVGALAEAAEHLGAGVTPEFQEQEVAEFQTLAQALMRAHLEIQERIRLQQQLLHSQRMETLGTLAGGIAHDVNNRLGAIMGQLFLAREALPESHPASQRIAQAEASASRCAQTTKSLLSFSRQGRPDLAALEINEFLQSSAEILNRLLGGMVEIRLDLGLGPLNIQGDPLHLEQVLMNLAVNARDAMPQGGSLFFRTRRAEDGWIELSVQDNGQGIAPEVLSHIFEPFYTTKPVGQGTGLGLSTVLGVVQSHDGRIEVESKVGVGTTFLLRFPPSLVGDSASEPKGPQASVSGPLSGLRILVVEDEAYLLETLEDALVGAGAQAAGALSGEAAWRLFQEQAFDCILSDQRMPGCTGVELLDRIRKAGSTVPFILASGQELESQKDLLKVDPNLRLLAKPFSIAVLRELIAGLGLR